MHIKTFLQRVAEAKRAKGFNVADHSDEGFNNYLRWFQPRTRLQLLPDAYTDVILEEPLPFDQLGNLAYNKLVREGRQVDFAPAINFVVSLFFFLFCGNLTIISTCQLCVYIFIYMLAHGDPEASE
jgi:hypothetical protein